MLCTTPPQAYRCVCLSSYPAPASLSGSHRSAGTTSSTAPSKQEGRHGTDCTASSLSLVCFRTLACVCSQELLCSSTLCQASRSHSKQSRSRRRAAGCLGGAWCRLCEGVVLHWTSRVRSMICMISLSASGPNISLRYATFRSSRILQISYMLIIVMKNRLRPVYRSSAIG